MVGKQNGEEEKKGWKEGGLRKGGSGSDKVRKGGGREDLQVKRGVIMLKQCLDIFMGSTIRECGKDSIFTCLWSISSIE